MLLQQLPLVGGKARPVTKGGRDGGLATQAYKHSTAKMRRPASVSTVGPATHQHGLLAAQPVLVHSVRGQLQPGACACGGCGLLPCQLHHQLGLLGAGLHACKAWVSGWRATCCCQAVHLLLLCC